MACLGLALPSLLGISLLFGHLLPEKSVEARAGSKASQGDGEWLTVKRGDLEIVCQEDGELRPVKVTTIIFLRAGEIAWMVPEGTRVKKGEPLVTLKKEDLEEKAAQLEDELAGADRNLLAQKQSLELELKRVSTDLATEKDRLAYARLKEKELLSKPTPLEVETAANALALAAARLQKAQVDYDLLLPLLKEGFAGRADLDQKRLELEMALLQLTRARLQEATTQAGVSVEERQKAVLERQQAEFDFQLKELDGQVSTKKQESQLRSAKFQVERLNYQLDAVRKSLSESTRLAPHDGIAVYRLLGHHNPVKVKVGDRVDPWRPPMDLPSYDYMKVRTQVPESVVRFLRSRRTPGGEARTEAHQAQTVAGSPARVWVKTLPGVVYPAEVTWIDGWARDRNATLSEADIKRQGLSGVCVFNVEVEIKQSDPERLREGFRATVEFPLERIAGVLSIPIRAVGSKHGQAIVQVRQQDEPQPRVLGLGRTSNGRVEVVSGLAEGEQVWVPLEQEPAPAALPRLPPPREEGVPKDLPGPRQAGENGASRSPSTGFERPEDVPEGAFPPTGGRGKRGSRPYDPEAGPGPAPGQMPGTGRGGRGSRRGGKGS